jgi:hypothetical protein
MCSWRSAMMGSKVPVCASNFFAEFWLVNCFSMLCYVSEFSCCKSQLWQLSMPVKRYRLLEKRMILFDLTLQVICSWQQCAIACIRMDEFLICTGRANAIFWCVSAVVFS